MTPAPTSDDLFTPEDFGAISESARSESNQSLTLVRATNDEAFAAAVAVGGFTLSEGQAYEISTPIVIDQANTFVSGSGNSEIRNSVNTSNLIEVTADNVTISGLTLIGVNLRVEEDDQFEDRGWGIAADSVKNLRVENCNVFKQPNGGIRADGCDFVQIINCRCHLNVPDKWRGDMADIWAWRCSNIMIQGCQLLSNGDNNINFADRTENWIVTGCILDSLDEDFAVPETRLKRHAIVFGYTDTVGRGVFANNIVRRSNWSGIYGLTNNGSDLDILIASNLFEDNGGNSPAPGVQNGSAILLNQPGSTSVDRQPAEKQQRTCRHHVQQP